MEPVLSEELERPTGQICADCEAQLRFMEESWLVQVVQLQVIGGQLQYYPIVDEEDQNRDFLFSPYFFCFSCWENLYEGLEEDVDGQPPVEDVGCVADCVCCGSSVLEGEYCGLLTLGEFQVSRRSPDGVQTPRFETSSAPDILCFYCLTLLNEGGIEMWEDLTQFGECDDCIFCRCWRGGTCACSCHIPDPELQVTTNGETQ